MYGVKFCTCKPTKNVDLLPNYGLTHHFPGIGLEMFVVYTLTSPKQLWKTSLYIAGVDNWLVISQALCVP